MKRRWLLVPCAAIATLSCQLIIGLDEPKGSPAPPVDAGHDANVDPCTHALPPARPTTDDDPTTKHDYWLAVSDLRGPLEPDAHGVHPGFDLDTACTCQKDLRDGAAPCVTPGNPDVCDTEGGVDDAFARTFGAGSNFGTLLAATGSGNPVTVASSSIKVGSRTILIYLQNYNDKANDADVSVQIVNSTGLYTQDGCPGQTGRTLKVANDDFDAGPFNIRYYPAFDGCDRWTADVGQVIGAFPNRVPKTSAQGYVADHKLVVQLGTFTASLVGGPSVINEMLFVATLAHDDTKNIMTGDGIFAGRMPSGDLLKAVGGNQVGDGFKDGGFNALCNEPFLWNQIQPELCRARDLMSSSTEDFRNSTCDAVSVTFGFSLVQSQLADLDYSRPFDSTVCPDTDCSP